MAAYGNVYSQAIQHHLQLFVDNVDPADIIDRLFQSGLLNYRDIEKVSIKALPRFENCETLVRILVREVHSENSFKNLLAALELHYIFVADKLRKYVSQPPTEAPVELLTYDDSEAARASRGSSTAFQPSDSAADSKHPIQETNGSIYDEPNGSYDYAEHIWRADDTDDHVDGAAVYSSREHYVGSSSDIVNWACAVGERSNENTAVKRRNLCCGVSCDSPVLSLPRSMPPSNRGHWFASDNHCRLFDQLASLVNNGVWHEFDRQVTEFRAGRSRHPDADFECIMLYLGASCCIIRSEYEACTQKINDGLKIMPFTKTPTRVTVQLLSLRIWVNLKTGGRLSEMENDTGISKL
jgi:hypothetical protein